jgi:hypothetical protein
MPRLRLLLPALAVLAAAVLAAVLLTGRGGEPPRGADPAALATQAFANAAPVRDGRLALALEIRSRPPAGEPLALRIAGPFAARSARGVPRFDLTVRVGGAQTGLVSTGEAGFVRVGATPYRLDAPTWGRLREGFAGDGEGRAGAALPLLGLSPARWLRAPREVGRRDEDGVAVVHLAGTAQPAELARDLAGLVRAARGLAGAGAGGGLGARLEAATVDLWTGAGDGTLRRLVVRGRLAARRAGAPAGALRLDLRYADLNTGVAVPEPEGSRPLEDLGPALAAGAPAGYERCVRRAGSDTAALQRCARRG